MWHDLKGLHAKAGAGSISDFTGTSSPYETPKRPIWCSRELRQPRRISPTGVIAHLLAGGL
jgi:adenylylsulfate kinase-like enzyme